MRLVESGKKYEEEIHKNLKGTIGLVSPSSKPAGSGNGHDLRLAGEVDGKGVELKHGRRNPAWGQAVIVKDKSGEWKVSQRTRLPPLIVSEFNRILNQLEIKHNGKSGNENHVISETSPISNFYKYKGNGYIQWKGKGLFKTSENDPYGFGVPRFRPTKGTGVRIRSKSHGKGRRSVTAVLRPIGSPKKSNVTFDDLSTLPKHMLR
jgi:hypothetical protein